MAANIAAEALLALRDLHKRNDHPEVYASRIDSIRDLVLRVAPKDK